jgi:hypothetical protein
MHTTALVLRREQRILCRLTAILLATGFLFVYYCRHYWQVQSGSYI